MKIQEMVYSYNSELSEGEEPITFSEMCVQMRARGITLSHADTARGYIEDVSERLLWLDTDWAKIVYTNDEIEKIKQSYLDHRAFWQGELDKCNANDAVSDIEIARLANNLHYAIEHQLGTEEQRQKAIDEFIEKVV